MIPDEFFILKLLDRFIIEHPPPRISRDFLIREDCLAICCDLLGCLIFTKSSSPCGTDREANTRIKPGKTGLVKKSAKLKGISAKENSKMIAERNEAEKAREDGKTLSHSQSIDDVVTVCRITEVEAYLGPNDKASHAYNNKRTQRNETMYDIGGTAYLYLCYGVHTMFNIVTNVIGKKSRKRHIYCTFVLLCDFVLFAIDVPHAILVRGGMPVAGIEQMQRRRHIQESDFLSEGDNRMKTQRAGSSIYGLSRGPGCLTKSLGLQIEDNGEDLIDGIRIYITEGPDITAFIEFVHREILSQNVVKMEELTDDGLILLILECLNGKLHLFDRETTRLKIRLSPRIGVDYAGKDSELLYRFYLDGDPSVSKHPTRAKRSGVGKGKRTNNVSKQPRSDAILPKRKLCKGLKSVNCLST